VARLASHREALLLELALVRFEPAFQQGHQVATGQPMPRKPAHPLQQFAKFTICRK